jgi:type II secretory pathway component PulF
MGITMNLQDMYPAVLTLVLVSILIGVGLTVLSNLGNSSGISATANTSIQSSITAISGFTTWFTIIVIIIAAAIIIGMVIRSFRG